MKIVSCNWRETFCFLHGIRTTVHAKSMLRPGLHHPGYTPFQANKRVKYTQDHMVGIRLGEILLQNLDFLVACSSLAIATQGLILRGSPEVSENLEYSHYGIVSLMSCMSDGKKYPASWARSTSTETCSQLLASTGQDIATLSCSCLAWSSLVVLYKRRFVEERHGWCLLTATVAVVVLVSTTTIAADFAVMALFPWLLIFALIIGSLWERRQEIESERSSQCSQLDCPPSQNETVVPV